MPPYRRERAGDLIRNEFTRIVRNVLHDPRVQNMTITEVVLTEDKRIARVYVACYDGEEKLRDGLKGLNSAKGFLRRELNKLLSWRFCPEIEFRVDRSWEYGAKIDSLLGEIRGQAPDGDDVDQS